MFKSPKRRKKIFDDGDILVFYNPLNGKAEIKLSPTHKGEEPAVYHSWKTLWIERDLGIGEAWERISISPEFIAIRKSL